MLFFPAWNPSEWAPAFRRKTALRLWARKGLMTGPPRTWWHLPWRPFPCTLCSSTPSLVSRSSHRLFPPPRALVCFLPLFSSLWVIPTLFPAWLRCHSSKPSLSPSAPPQLGSGLFFLVSLARVTALTALRVGTGSGLPSFCILPRPLPPRIRCPVPWAPVDDPLLPVRHQTRASFQHAAAGETTFSRIFLYRLPDLALEVQRSKFTAQVGCLGPPAVCSWGAPGSCPGILQAMLHPGGVSPCCGSLPAWSSGLRRILWAGSTLIVSSGKLDSRGGLVIASVSPALVSGELSAQACPLSRLGGGAGGRGGHCPPLGGTREVGAASSSDMTQWHKMNTGAFQKI